MTVRDHGRPVAGAAAQPRRMALLALLARAGERGVTRDSMLACLWPDVDDERGRRGLAQALYALRRDLGSDDAIVGQRELQLNRDVVGSDVAEFCASLARGQLEDAVGLYLGPFLEGFYLAAAPEFERWTEHERVQLAHQYAAALESLATAAAERGDPAGAARWWRLLAARDPLNARVALGLMRALAAAGDRAGALQHARIYETLVEQELELPPDRDVVRLARQLRADATATTTPIPPPRSEPSPVVARTSGSGADGRCVVAIGEIIDARGGAAAPARPLVDMLATNLARSPRLCVVSPARLDELLHDTAHDQRARVAAARQAGATQLVDGTVYALGPTTIRLDLRRVDLVSGHIADVHSASGPDVFALLDGGAASLLARMPTA